VATIAEVLAIALEPVGRELAATQHPNVAA
jgi:hypothetical protein